MPLSKFEERERERLRRIHQRRVHQARHGRAPPQKGGRSVSRQRPAGPYAAAPVGRNAGSANRPRRGREGAARTARPPPTSSRESEKQARERELLERERAFDLAIGISYREVVKPKAKDRLPIQYTRREKTVAPVPDLGPTQVVPIEGSVYARRPRPPSGERREGEGGRRSRASSSRASSRASSRPGSSASKASSRASSASRGSSRAHAGPAAARGPGLLPDIAGAERSSSSVPRSHSRASSSTHSVPPSGSVSPADAGAACTVASPIDRAAIASRPPRSDGRRHRTRSMGGRQRPPPLFLTRSPRDEEVRGIAGAFLEAAMSPIRGAAPKRGARLGGGRGAGGGGDPQAGVREDGVGEGGEEEDSYEAAYRRCSARASAKGYGGRYDEGYGGGGGDAGVDVDDDDDEDVREIRARARMLRAALAARIAEVEAYGGDADGDMDDRDSECGSRSSSSRSVGEFQPDDGSFGAVDVRDGSFGVWDDNGADAANDADADADADATNDDQDGGEGELADEEPDYEPDFEEFDRSALLETSLAAVSALEAAYDAGDLDAVEESLGDAMLAADLLVLPPPGDENETAGAGLNDTTARTVDGDDGDGGGAYEAPGSYFFKPGSIPERGLKDVMPPRHWRAKDEQQYHFKRPVV